MKKPKNITIFALLLLLTACQSNSIKLIKSFEEVNFNEIPSGSLVVFDVDNTLQQSTDTYIAHSRSGSILSKNFNQELKNSYPSVKDWDNLLSISLIEANNPLIEPLVIEKINNLKKRKIPIIACTGMNIGKLGYIEKMEKWRYNQLEALGFKGSYENLVIDLPSDSNYHPIFYKGIIATDKNHNKGAVLGAFLDIVRIRPRYIIMFDDNREYLDSMKAECAKKGITFYGYHYNGYKSKPWDKKLIMFQANYLIKYRKWISDEEAYKLMEEQSHTDCKKGK